MYSYILKWVNTFSYIQYFFSKKEHTKSNYEELVNIILVSFYLILAFSTHSLLCYIE